MSLQEAVHATIMKAEVEKRQVLWDNLLLTGGSSLIKGLKARLERELIKLMPASEVTHEYQPKDCKWLHIPEYIIAYNEAPNFASFLGGAIISKV